MTNGCFDLIHPGHIAYLEEAKSLGDILIVAINTDASVKKLKGNDRPINTLNDRAKILKALNCVDYVISFSSTSPKELYSKILPDILVKGGDYKSSNVEGGAEVLKDGGAVEILKFIDGYSSSSIIDRIKNIDS
jgi:D-beta-D-heptose 7-phosphate kinase/D-beta-D-heptose 1-phosphate adenosyltransferase